MRVIYEEKIKDKDSFTYVIHIVKIEKGDYKYRLVLLKDNKRVVCFDNYGKHKPHKHVGDKRLPYEFESIWKLIEDYWEEVDKFKKKSEVQKNE